MKKKLNETEITNELRDASLYFQPKTQTRRRSAANAQKTAQETTLPETTSPETTVAEPLTADEELARAQEAETDQELAAQQPTPFVEETPISPAVVSAPPPAVSSALDHAQLIETIRKAVKPVGKEATFCRFTPDEKNVLTDLVYAFKRHEFIPIRTSENEIIRIAVAWLVENYRSEGEESILTKVLVKLNA